MKIAIIDMGTGNLQSVANALEYCGAASVVVSRPTEKLDAFDGIILPGVGAFGEAMRNLAKYELSNVIKEVVLKDKKPILGICLGMQLLFNSSTENGYHEGLGVIEGKVERIDDDTVLPHVGWNDIFLKNPSKILTRELEGKDFYFDHSYHAKCPDKLVTCEVAIAGNRYVAGIESENIFGTQFHPEKSQVFGIKILSSFIGFCGRKNA